MPPEGAVLVDDVVTTGATIDLAAAMAGDVHHAVTLTAGPMALRGEPAAR